MPKGIFTDLWQKGAREIQPEQERMPAPLSGPLTTLAPQPVGLGAEKQTYST
jgi:hypothetical protein